MNMCTCMYVCTHMIHIQHTTHTYIHTHNTYTHNTYTHTQHIHTHNTHTYIHTYIHTQHTYTHNTHTHTHTHMLTHTQIRHRRCCLTTMAVWRGMPVWWTSSRSSMMCALTCTGRGRSGWRVSWQLRPHDSTIRHALFSRRLTARLL